MKSISFARNLENMKKKTIGMAFDSYFNNPAWTGFTNKGYKVVNFSDIKRMTIGGKAGIINFYLQFFIKKDTFKINICKMNGKVAPDFIYINVINDVF